jgi:hypothetical protein
MSKLKAIHPKSQQLIKEAKNPSATSNFLILWKLVMLSYKYKKITDYLIKG